MSSKFFSSFRKEPPDPNAPLPPLPLHLHPPPPPPKRPSLEGKKERSGSDEFSLQTTCSCRLEVSRRIISEKTCNLIWSSLHWIFVSFATAGRSRQTLNLHRRRRQEITWRKTGLGSGDYSVSHLSLKKYFAVVSGGSVTLDYNLFFVCFTRNMDTI